MIGCTNSEESNGGGGPGRVGERGGSMRTFDLPKACSPKDVATVLLVRVLTSVAQRRHIWIMMYVTMCVAYIDWGKARTRYAGRLLLPASSSSASTSSSFPLPGGRRFIPCEQCDVLFLQGPSKCSLLPLFKACAPSPSKWNSRTFDDRSYSQILSIHQCPDPWTSGWHQHGWHCWPGARCVNSCGAGSEHFSLLHVMISQGSMCACACA